MNSEFLPAQLRAVATITQDLLGKQVKRGIEQLRALKDEVYTSIPEKQRTGRGITWVVERISGLLAGQGLNDETLRHLAVNIYQQLNEDDLLIGVAIFLMADYGMRHPAEAFGFFETAASAPHWIVREFSAGAFRKLIRPNKDIVSTWLHKMAQAIDPCQRRFASETLRPVTHNKWLNQQPEYSLCVLRSLFKESHPYPRTSVGNNLSDLSRRQPELIYDLVNDLVASGDINSHWIAYRACRNLVKKDPQRVMNLLRVEEYHYKDRNFFKNVREVKEL